MLAIVSGACSVVDSVTINIWARCAGLPRQCQCGCGLGILKEKSAAEQERRCKNDGTSRNLPITMEFIVNAVELSTERASTAVPFSIFVPPQAKERISPRSGGGESKRVKGIEPSCPAWEAGVLPLNYTRVRRISDFRFRIADWQIAQSLPGKNIVRALVFVIASRCRATTR